MKWAERIAKKEPVFAGRCEWCAAVLDGWEGILVLMPSPGNDVTTSSHYRRFCNEACTKAYDAAEQERYRHRACE